MLSIGIQLSIKDFVIVLKRSVQISWSSCHISYLLIVCKCMKHDMLLLFLVLQAEASSCWLCFSIYSQTATWLGCGQGIQNARGICCWFHTYRMCCGCTTLKLCQLSQRWRCCIKYCLDKFVDHHIGHCYTSTNRAPHRFSCPCRWNCYGKVHPTGISCFCYESNAHVHINYALGVK